MNNYIYLRALKHADYTVFCVQDGQKVYYDPQFNVSVPFSSGQQVKRSILTEVTDLLNVISLADVDFIVVFAFNVTEPL